MNIMHKLPDTPTHYFSRSTTLVNSPAPEKVATGPAHHYARIASAFFCVAVIGWGDGATGAVLPEMQSHFQLNFLMGSILFTIASTGFSIATFFVEPLSHILGRFHISAEKRSRFPFLYTQDTVAYSPSKGRHLSLFLAGLLHCIYFLFAACSPHYYGVLIAFLAGGVGKCILIAQMQSTISFYVSHLDLLPFSKIFWATNPPVTGIFLLHGTYGVGAFFSPLLSQTIRAHGYPWRGFFWISLGLAVLNVSFSLFAFATTEEEFEMEKGLAIASDTLSRAKFVGKYDIECTPQTFDEKAKEQKGMHSAHNDKSILTSIGKIITTPYVWTIAFFLGVYQGAETIGQGFIVTFLLHERNANPNVVGYAASGFWGGLALGRSTWGCLSPYVSQRGKIFYVNFALALGMTFHVLIWRVDNMIANSVLISLIGFFVGPTFPLVLDIATNQNTKQTQGILSLFPVFSTDVQPAALVIGSCIAALGGAIFPLAAGAAATEYGAYAVEPLAMATLGFVLIFWLGAQVVSKITRK